MPGFLTDGQIQTRLEAGELIDTGTWDVGCVRHASYSLRVGSRIEVERAGQARDAERQRLALTLVAGRYLELEPGDTALIYSIERLRLPKDVMGFTVARGLLFVETLSPENTYVDPGFNGNLYTTVTNLSSRILRIPYGSTIARLFLYQLSEDVRTPYRTGPAIGIEQHLDSAPAISSQIRVADQSVSGLIGVIEKSERSGPEIAEISRRDRQLSIAALTSAVVWPIALILINTKPNLRSQLGGDVLANFVGTILAALVIYLAPKLWRRFSGT